MSQNTKYLVRSYLDALAVGNQAVAEAMRPRIDKQAKLQRLIIDHIVSGRETTARAIARATNNTQGNVLQALYTMEKNGTVIRVNPRRAIEWALL